MASLLVSGPMNAPHYTLRRHEETDTTDAQPERDALAAEIQRHEKQLRELVIEERRTSWATLATVDVLSPDERESLGDTSTSTADALVDDVWRMLEEQVALEGPTRFRVRGWSLPHGRRPLFERAFVVGVPTMTESRREAELATSSMLQSQAVVIDKLARTLERSYAGREAACASREAATLKLGSLVEQVLDAVGKAATGIFAGAASDLHKLALQAEIKAEDNRHAEAQREADSQDEMLMEVLRLFAANMTAGKAPTPPPPSGVSSGGKTCREARDMARVLQTLGARDAAEQTRVRELVGDDAWALITSAAEAPDQQTFDALFGRFYSGLHARGRDEATRIVSELTPLLGLDAMVLMRLAQDYEARHRGAR